MERTPGRAKGQLWFVFDQIVQLCSVIKDYPTDEVEIITTLGFLSNAPQQPFDNSLISLNNICSSLNILRKLKTSSLNKEIFFSVIDYSSS